MRFLLVGLLMFFCLGFHTLEAGDRSEPKCFSFTEIKEAGVTLSHRIFGTKARSEAQRNHADKDNESNWYDLLQMGNRALFVQVKF